jgi:uncharacterized protein Yka (UPF0111/DUF47 family)
VELRLNGMADNRMFSIQKFFGREDKFFDLLEASAEEARASVQALVRLIQTGGSAQLDPFVESRRKDKRIKEQISEELVRTFVTMLEREDIEALSNALYKVPKTVEKFAEHYIMAGPHVKGVDFSRQIHLLEQATDTIVAMVKKLRHVSDLEEIKDLNSKLQSVEGQADKLMLDLLRDLFSGGHDTLKVIALKDLYELLERVVDRCRDAGNVVSHIVLKNS